MSDTVFGKLDCGVDYGVIALPRRHVVSFQIRLLAGAGNEPADKLGLARITAETLDKATAKRSGREWLDALDAIGAMHGAGTGQETSTFTCTVLPEHFDEAVALHAEMLRTPAFEEEAFRVNVDLAKQELVALQDDAQGLVDTMLSLQVFGPILGRHPLGEADALDAMTRDDLIEYQQRYYQAGRMIVSVAGAIEPARAAEVFETHFGGFGSSAPAGREPFPAQFDARITHHDKDLEQQQIGIGWPGVPITHDDFRVQQVMLGVLSGGMSGRLFTEVREKQGLVYWVGAWQETPRGCGMIFMGASTTPERCDKTYKTLLSEVDRLAEDIEPDELERAITGLVASRQTRGDTTQARCGELGGDLFHHGHPVSPEEKVAKIRAVTIDQVKQYLATYPRDRLSVVTLGPRALAVPQPTPPQPTCPPAGK